MTSTQRKRSDKAKLLQRNIIFDMKRKKAFRRTRMNTMLIFFVLFLFIYVFSNPL